MYSAFHSFVLFDYFFVGMDSLTDSFRDEKAEKETRFFSGTLTIVPLDGLRAVRAFAIFELNLPNPEMLTSFFSLRACFVTMVLFGQQSFERVEIYPQQ
jgi:hypothetical protein